VNAVKRDWTQAVLSPRQRALCACAVKLTRAPASMSAADVGALRGEGLSDREMLDAVQVIGYFNYINRLVAALGVLPEDFMPVRSVP
jgi:uncharacterized peroxidase-related enzyme